MVDERGCGALGPVARGLEGAAERVDANATAAGGEVCVSDALRGALTSDTSRFGEPQRGFTRTGVPDDVTVLVAR